MMQEVFFILVAFFALECFCFREPDEKCLHKESMCDFDFQRCFHESLGSIEECQGLSYPKFYKTEADVKFMVNISNFSSYAEDLTMKLVRYHNGTGTAVKNCCALRFNESCTLPGFLNASYMLFAPCKKEGSYCYREIDAYDAIQLLWCEENEKLPCLEVQDGKVEIKELLMEISRFNHLSPMEFCVFSAPEWYVHQTAKNDEVLFMVEGITINGTDVIGKGFKTSCVVSERAASFNVTRHLLHDDVQPGFVKCSFVRQQRFGGWTKTPRCVSVHSDHSTQDFSHVIISVTTAVIFVILVIVIVFVCKRFVRSFIPSYKATVGDGVISGIVDLESHEYTSISDKDETVYKEGQKKGKRSSNEEIIRYVGVCLNSSQPSHNVKERVCEIVPQNQSIEEETTTIDTTSVNGITITIREDDEILHNIELEVTSIAESSNESGSGGDSDSKQRDDGEISQLPTDLNDNKMDKLDSEDESIPKPVVNFDYITKGNTIFTTDHERSLSTDKGVC